MTEATRYRICPICEAGCGLKITMQDQTIVRIRGNDSDRFSAGHVCPKGIALAGLHTDTRRLHQPRIREGDTVRNASWNEAFSVTARRLAELRQKHGNDAVAVYIGNPTAHNVGISMGLGQFAGRLGSRNVYSAASVDQLPKQLASALMFGNDMAVPIPDIERTDCLLMLGANPVVSNGSLWMVPGFRDKVRALRARGGRLIVVDPRRTETARLADEHLSVQPGSDAWLLAGLINQLVAAGTMIPDRYAVEGADSLLKALSGIELSEVANRTGLPVDRIQALAVTLRTARSPVVYGRIGTTLQRFGTLTSFLVEVLNLMLGSLDTPGGAVFGEQVFAAPGPHARPQVPLGRWHSRVSGRPEVGGQLPVVCLREEIETPGTGQIRALVCFAGNPLLSTPDAGRLRRALGSLEFIVAVDIFDTETAALADVLLPGTSPFEESHYDHYLGDWSWKSVARYSPPLLPLDDRPDEWTLCLQLAYGLVSSGAVADATTLAGFEDGILADLVYRHVSDPDSPIAGRDVQEILGRIEPLRGVERVLDLGFRAGLYGDGFGAREGLTLERVRQAPDGIELGPLRPRLAQVVRHPDGALQLAPALILQEIRRLRESVADEPVGGGSAADRSLVLIGRRNVKSNNSWLHGIVGLDRGMDVCVLDMNRDDAAERGIGDGDKVRLFNRRSRQLGSLEVTVRVGDDLTRGVVCFPHGFPGANYNLLASTAEVDEPTGTAALNGIAVEIAPL